MAPKKKKITIHDLGDPNGIITGSMVKFAVGGMRFDHEIEAGWALSPSLGMVARDIERLGLEIENMREPITKSIVQVMIPSIDRNFREEGRPPWEELAEYTVKMRNFRERPILQRTGALRRGVTKLYIWHIKDDSATILSLPPFISYGVLHQGGYGGYMKWVRQARGVIGPGKGASRENDMADKLIAQAKAAGTWRTPRAFIPQRRFLMFQEQDIDDILQIFAEWLEDKVKEVGWFTGRSVRTVWGGPSFG